MLPVSQPFFAKRKPAPTCLSGHESFHLIYLPAQRDVHVQICRGQAMERARFAPGIIGVRMANEDGIASWDRDVPVFVIGIKPQWFLQMTGVELASVLRNNGRLTFRSFQVETAIRDMINEIDSPRYLSGPYSEALAQLICLHTARTLQGEGQKAAAHVMPPAKLRRVLDYLDSRYTGKVALPEIAREAGMSVRHLCRCFRAQTGRTPHGYVTQARVRQAQVLMQTTDMTMAEIAFQVGFKTHSHFCSVYRRITGETAKRFMSRG